MGSSPKRASPQGASPEAAKAVAQAAAHWRDLRAAPPVARESTAVRGRRTAVAAMTAVVARADERSPMPEREQLSLFQFSSCRRMVVVAMG